MKEAPPSAKRSPSKGAYHPHRAQRLWEQERTTGSMRPSQRVGRGQVASCGLVRALVRTTPRVREAAHHVLTWSPWETFAVLSLPRRERGLGQEIQVEPVWDVSQGLKSSNICLLRGTGPSQSAPVILSGSHCLMEESPVGQLPGILHRALHCAWERPPQSGKKLSPEPGLAVMMTLLSHPVRPSWRSRLSQSPGGGWDKVPLLPLTAPPAPWCLQPARLTQAHPRDREDPSMLRGRGEAQCPVSSNRAQTGVQTTPARTGQRNPAQGASPNW